MDLPTFEELLEVEEELGDKDIFASDSEGEDETPLALLQPDDLVSSNVDKKEAAVHHEHMMHKQEIAWLRERDVLEEQASKKIKLSDEQVVPLMPSSKSDIEDDIGHIEKGKGVALKGKTKGKKAKGKKIKLSGEKAVQLMSSSKDDVKDDIGDIKKSKVKGRRKKEKTAQGWKGWVIEEIEDAVKEDAVNELNEGKEDDGQGMRRSLRMKRKRE
ncbi:hypothetical protein DFH28DRAFT_926493 [Melampsora americana]|nr:hypothetical protein DFH28DRAFT_926493 [Melampsora americana]